MKDHIHVTILATWTVLLLCLRPGQGISDMPEEGYLDFLKRDDNPQIKSVKFDRDAINEFFRNMARVRPRTYLTDHDEVFKRQLRPGQTSSLISSLDMLIRDLQRASERLEYEALVAANREAMDRGGKR